MKLGIYPKFNTYTHDLIHLAIFESLNLKPVSNIEFLATLKLTPCQKILTFIQSLRFFIELQLIKDRQKGIKFKGINILHCLVESSIRFHSSDGRFNRYNRKTFYLLHTIISSIAKLENHPINDLVGLHIGGDEAYFPDSIISQFLVKKSIKSIYLKQINDLLSIFEFNTDTLYAGPNFGKLTLFKTLRENLEIESHGYMRTRQAAVQNLSFLENSFVLYLHDFIDSPGVYGNPIFFDQWEWLSLCIRSFEKYQVRLVIKSHPNCNESNIYSLEKLKSLVKGLEFVSFVETDFFLKDVKGYANGVLTIFGSIIAEAAYYEIPCLSASLNHPFLNFNLTNIVSSKADYEKKLEEFIINPKIFLKRKIDSKEYTYILNSIRYIPFNQNLFLEDVPYDDMNPIVFSKLFPSIDSSGFGIHERRKVFLNSDETKEYMLKLITSRKRRIDDVISSMKLFL